MSILLKPRLSIPTMLQLKKSVQLESLRLPMRAALIAAHEIGAEGVEINGRTELRVEEMTRTAVRHLRKILDDLKLKVSAIYYPTRRGLGVAADIEPRLEGIKAAMRLAYDLGAEVVVSKIGRVPTDTASESWTTMLQAATELGSYSQRSGAWLAARTDGGNSEELKNLLDQLPAWSLAVDFDPGDFVIHGKSPVVAMDLLAAHVRSFRARDAATDLSRGRGIEVQLGRGSIEWAPLLGKLEENHFTGYMTIERDADENAVQQCAEGLEFLTNLFD